MDFFDTLIHLGFGAALIILAAAAFIKRWSWSATDMVLLLTFGAALVTLGLLDLIGVMDATWIHISRNIIFGSFFILRSISALHSPSSPKDSRWTQWAMLILGVGLAIYAITEVFFLSRS